MKKRFILGCVMPIILVLCVFVSVVAITIHYGTQNSVERAFCVREYAGRSVSDMPIYCMKYFR